MLDRLCVIYIQADRPSFVIMTYDLPQPSWTSIKLLDLTLCKRKLEGNYVATVVTFDQPLRNSFLKKQLLMTLQPICNSGHLEISLLIRHLIRLTINLSFLLRRSEKQYQEELSVRQRDFRRKKKYNCEKCRVKSEMGNLSVKLKL